MTSSMPGHVAIIMDGNGRWARQRRRPRVLGHRVGAKAVRRSIEYAVQRGIAALTLFAFSSENWNRPSQEVNALMRLFMGALEREVPVLHEKGVRLRFIGDRSRFDEGIRSRMARAEQTTAGNTVLSLNIAASYGGRQDIAHAARALAREVAAGRLDPEAIDETLLGQYVELADLPPPDLLIRTGGDLRISNFLLWQMAYTEFWFTDVLWPDFDPTVFAQALDDYVNRERRFGLTSAQIASSLQEEA